MQVLLIRLGYRMVALRISHSSRRILWLVAVACVLVCTSFAYSYFWLARPVGQDPAGPVVPRSLYARPWAIRQALLIGLGDSITAGFGARRYYSYFDMLATNSPNDSSEMEGISLSSVLSGLRVTNLAVSGTTSFEHLEKQLPHLPATASNVTAIIVMTTGGNDLIHNYGRSSPRDRAMYGATLQQAGPWIDAFNQRLEAMLAQIETIFPGRYQLFVGDIFDPTDGVGDIQRTGLPPWKDGPEILKSYNTVFYAWAKRHPRVHIIPIHDAFLGHGIHCAQFWSAHYHENDPHYWYYENLEDPNERGHDAVRRLFLIEIAKTLTQPKND